MSETGSQVSWDDFSDSRCVSPALSCDFDISDTSWADSAVSPDLEIMTSPEPPSNASIWARFNSGLSRFTQDLGKTPAVAPSSAIPSVHVNPLSVDVPPRDDFVEGAESDLKLERSDSGHWSLTESFRKFSAGFNTKSYHSNAADTNQFGSKMVANSHSSNMLDDACDPKLAEDDISDDVLSQLTMRDNNDVGVSASSSSVTVTLDHSTTGPFTSMPADNPTDLPDEVLGRSSPLNSVPDHPAAKSSDELSLIHI